MASLTAPIFKIIPTTQQYDWGKTGSSSKVAQFASKSKVPNFTLDENTPYAEVSSSRNSFPSANDHIDNHILFYFPDQLWMGTHPSSPARLITGATLSSHLASHPTLLGRRVLERFASDSAASGNLPFLLKVLAIAKALSIQTHPDKAMAERLHAARPDVYKDANHKPEMALALTDFEALCGFRPLAQIAAFLRCAPEFRALVPHGIVEAFEGVAARSASGEGPEEKAALKNLFAAVMTAERDVFAVQLDRLVKRYEGSGASVEERAVKELVLRINEQFPVDIGTFCAFMLNYVRMVPGDAIFLAAGEPHAYISGGKWEHHIFIEEIHF
jgi:mannose-6-phosphate isomerase